MQQALDLGSKVMVGHVFGIAGLSWLVADTAA
jgi:hypothetical protein